LTRKDSISVAIDKNSVLCCPVSPIDISKSNGLEDGLFIGRQVDLSSIFNICILCKHLPDKFAVYLISQETATMQ